MPNTPHNVAGNSHTADATGRLSHKLLLVDDEADGAELAAALMSARGLDVVVVHSANEALLVLQNDHHIDAILSDIMMPGMTGLQLAEKVGILYPTIKVILTSGFFPPAAFNNREPPYLFATKPYRVDTILELLGG